MNEQQNNRHDLGHRTEQPVTMSNGYYDRATIDPLLIINDPRTRQEVIDLDQQLLESNQFLGLERSQIAHDLGIFSFMDGDNELLISAAKRMPEAVLPENCQSLAEIQNTARVSELDMLRILMKEKATKQKIDGNDSLTKGDKSKERLKAHDTMESSLTADIIIGSSLALRTLGFLGPDHPRVDDRQVIGLAFELFYVTHQKLKAFQEQNYDEEITMSAPAPCDASRISFTPNHNFDAMRVGTEYSTVTPIQCKSGQDDEEYHHSIEMVKGNAFIRFREEPLRYSGALKTVVENRAETSAAKLDQCIKDLSDLYSVELALDYDFAGSEYLSE